MTDEPGQHAARLRNHWWPRPGWTPGRDIFTWHLTFDHDQADGLHQLADAYQQQLATLPGLNLVPQRWLHLTLQAVGWVDETSHDDLDAVVHAVRDRLAVLPAFALTFSQAVVRSEAIALHPQPVEPVHELLDVLRAGIADALGDARVPTSTEQARGFQPHVSLAYSAGDHDTEPYAAALDAVQAEPVVVPITRVDLILQQRLLAPDWLYRWTTETSAQLTGTPPRTRTPRLVLIGGYAGSGKSELGRILARETGWPILDKDTLTRPIVEVALEALHEPRHVRESDTYLHTVRPAEYEALLAAITENLECGVSVIATAPFLREFTDRAWLDHISATTTTLGATTHLVWVHCDPDTMLTHLRQRGAARDTTKLTNWAGYLDSIDLDRRPDGEHTVIDNSQDAPPLQTQAQQLLTAITPASADAGPA